MSAPAIQLSDAARQRLVDLARRTGLTEADVLDQALTDYHRKLFFDRLNAGYAELRADPQALAEHLDERTAWDDTLEDGLDPAEHWTDDGRCLTPEDGKR
jgi:predicted transcriptional regulator